MGCGWSGWFQRKVAYSGHSRQILEILCNKARSLLTFLLPVNLSTICYFIIRAEFSEASTLNNEAIQLSSVLFTFSISPFLVFFFCLSDCWTSFSCSHLWPQCAMWALLTSSRRKCGKCAEVVLLFWPIKVIADDCFREELTTLIFYRK